LAKAARERLAALYGSDPVAKAPARRRLIDGRDSRRYDDLDRFPGRKYIFPGSPVAAGSEPGRLPPGRAGEIALGSIARRDEVLRLLAQLPRAPVVGDDEAFALIETRKLSASGIGWIDAHLLAAAMAASM